MTFRVSCSSSFIVAASCGFNSRSRSAQWNATAIEAETMQHFQALLRLDTSSPPGNEIRAVEYLQQVLRREGISYQVFAKDPQRPNLVARIKGNGKKRPILVMGHTDVVTVDPQKWTFPPFGATRDGGYVYGRGTVDDKDSVVAGLMLMLTLKRTGTALDRDVIFLAESGEEGCPRVRRAVHDRQPLRRHRRRVPLCRRRRRRALGWPRDAGDCWDYRERAASDPAHRARHVGPRLGAAEGQRHRAALDGAGEDLPHGCRRCKSARRRSPTSDAVDCSCRRRWRNAISDVLNTDPKVSAAAAAEWMLENQPQHWSMLHTSLVPTIIDGGYRYNVIPSEAKAIVDVRLHPEEDQKTFLDRVRAVVNDPKVEVRWSRDPYRPAGASRLNTEAFTVLQTQLKAHYNTVTLPMMGTGATDMSQVRSKGVQCYGIGPAIDTEDSGKRFRRAQRPGADSGERATPLRAFSVRRGDGTGASAIRSGTRDRGPGSGIR